MAHHTDRQIRGAAHASMAVLGGVMVLGLFASGPERDQLAANAVTSLDSVRLTVPAAASTTAGTDVALGEFTVSGSDDIEYTLTVVPAGSGVLTLGCADSCTDVVYEVGDGVADATVTLSGTSGAVTAALGAVTLVDPVEGTSTVEVSVLDRAAVAPGPGGHEYRYIPGTLAAAEARVDASTYRLYGEVGYLVTISSAEEETYVETLVAGATVHIGLEGTAAGGQNSWTWRYTGGPDELVTPTYFDWLPSEPHSPNVDADSIGLVRLRTKSTKTAWELALDDTACCGMVVEFGGTDPVMPHASVEVTVGVAPTTTVAPSTTEPETTTTSTTSTTSTTTTTTTTTSTTTTSTIAPAVLPVETTSTSAAPATTTSTTSTTTTTTIAPTTTAAPTTTTPAPTTTVPAPVEVTAEITVEAMIGDASAGAGVSVRGTGLEPGREVELGVHSTYTVIGTGTVAADGSFEIRGELPSGLEPGTHAIEVHYAGDPEPLDAATFEIDASGAIESGEERLAFSGYDPGAHAGVVVAAAIAALTVAGAAGGASGGGGGDSGGGGNDAGAVGEIDVEEALDGEFDGHGVGDRALAVTLPGTALLDRLASRAPTRLGSAVPGVARAIVGSSYLRAMFGSLSIAFPAAGLALGVFAASDAGFEALPPSTALLAAILVLSAFDGVAGLLAAVGFGASMLVTGAVDSLHAVLVVSGLAVVMTGVSLMAEMVRPLSRPPGKGFVGAWTRAGDAAVGALFVGWVVKSLIESLEGLSGRSLPIAADSGVLAMACMAAIVGRVGLETFVAHHYPARLRASRPQDEVPDYSVARRWVLLVARTGALMLAAQPFVGWNLYLLGGCLAYGFEQYLDIIQDRMPVVRRFAPIVPLRVFKFITSLIICTAVASLLERWVSGTDLVRVAFVVLNIPMTATETFIALGREGDRGPITWWRRAAGVGMVAVGAAIVTGYPF